MGLFRVPEQAEAVVEAAHDDIVTGIEGPKSDDGEFRLSGENRLPAESAREKAPDVGAPIVVGPEVQEQVERPGAAVPVELDFEESTLSGSIGNWEVVLSIAGMPSQPGIYRLALTLTTTYGTEYTYGSVFMVGEDGRAMGAGVSDTDDGAHGGLGRAGETAGPSTRLPADPQGLGVRLQRTTLSTLGARVLICS